MKAIESVYTSQLLYEYGLMGSPALPWHIWSYKEGKNFLHQLKQWEENNPSIDDMEMSVKGVLEKIRKKIAQLGDLDINSDLAHELLKMIPNDPFPVRSVVVGLVGIAIYGAVSDSRH